MEKGDNTEEKERLAGRQAVELNGRSRKRKLPSVRTGCNRYRVMRSRGLSAGKHVYILYYWRYMFLSTYTCVHTCVCTHEQYVASWI